MKFAFTSVVILAILASDSLAAERAITNDGRSVFLHSNGKWNYEESSDTQIYRQIEFGDFLIDGSQLLGKRIKIKGDGGFPNDRGETHPRGRIYQKTFTIGPSIEVSSSSLNRSNLMAAHECPLSCVLEISGVVEKTKYGGLLIQAEAVKILKK